MADDGRNHVMLSYQWDHQPVVKRIKTDLDKRGYKTWMDLSNMRGDINQSMAEGVEGADVIVMCVSNAYKVSFNCQKEMGYADAKRKPIVPLRMEKDVRFDGWLGPVMGSKLWIDFSDHQNFENSMEQLHKELEAKGVKVGHCTMESKTSEEIDLASLDVEGVCQWLMSLQLDDSTVETFRQNCVTGEDLVNLTKEDLSGDDFKISHFKTKKILRKRNEVMAEKQQSTPVSPPDKKSTPEPIKVTPPDTKSTSKATTMTPPGVRLKSKPVKAARTIGTHDGTSQWSVEVIGQYGENPGQFHSPRGLTWDPAGFLLVGEINSKRIQILNSAFECVDTITFPDNQFPQPFSPWDIALSNDNLYYVYDDKNKHVLVVDEKKAVIRIICQNENLTNIAVVDEYLYATDNEGHRLVKFTTMGQKVSEVKGQAESEGQFEEPWSVAVTSNHRIALSHPLGINFYDSNLKFVSSCAHKLSKPMGLCVDARNNIYICCYGNNSIVMVTKDGKCAVVHGDIWKPRFIAVTEGKTNRIAVTQWKKHHLTVLELGKKGT